MIFKDSEMSIPEADNIKYLGVTIDEYIECNRHI